MKRSVSISWRTLSIIFCLFLAVSGCGKKGSIPFSSPEGKFSIEFPADFGKPKQSAQEVPTDAGTIKMNFFMSDHSNSALMVMYSDFPEAVLQQKTVEQMLNDGRDNAVKAVGGILEKETPITVDGNQGREYFVTGKGEGKELFARYYFIIAGSRMYQVGGVFEKKSDLDNAEIKNFFSSFKIQK